MKNTKTLYFYILCAILCLPKILSAQWEYVGAPEKTHTRQVYQHRGYFFTLDESGQLYRMVVKGTAWQQIGQNIPAEPKMKIVGLFTNQKTLFAEVGDYWGSNRRYYRSTDLGETWTALDKLMNLSVYKMDQISVFGDTILARLRTKNAPLQLLLYYSHNGGKDWKKAQNVGQLPQDYWVQPLKVGDRFLVRSSRYNLIFESKDGGANWASFAPNGIKVTYAYYNFVAIGNSLFTQSPNSESIYQSKNFGRNWDPITIPNVQYIFGITAQNGYLSAMFSTLDNVLAAWISADTGQTWSQSAFIPTLMGKTFHNITSPLITSSTDQGKNWSAPRVFLPVSVDYNPIELAQSPFKSIAQHQDTIALAVTGGVAYSLNNGKNWVIIDKGLIPNHSVGSGKLLAVGPTVLSYRHGIFKSDNKGFNWQESTYQGLLAKPISSTYITSYKLYAADKNLFTNDGFTGYVTSDLGDHWDSVFTAKNATIYDFVPVGKRVFVSQYTPDYDFKIYYKDDLSGKVWRELPLPDGAYFTDISGDGDDLFLSDGFQTWQSNDLGQNWSVLPVNFNAVTAAGTNLIGSNYSPGAVFLSSDRGRNWENITDTLGILGRSIESIAMLGDKIFMALSGTWEDAIHYSPNAGKDWYDITNNLPDFYNLNLGELDITVPDDFRSLLIKDNYVYVSSYSGVYRMSLTQVSEPYPFPEVRSAAKLPVRPNPLVQTPPRRKPLSPAQRFAEWMQQVQQQKAEGKLSSTAH